MTIQFLTEDWAREVSAAANADDGFRAAAAGQQMLLQVSVSDSPTENRYFMHFQDGTITVGLGEAPSAPDVRAEMSYATNVALSQGNLSGQAAAMTGRMKVEGDMKKMMTIGKAQDRLAEIESGLKLEYQ